MEDREDHIQGILRLVDPAERERTKRLLKTPEGREKWLKRLRHAMEMHRAYTHHLAKGQRAEGMIVSRLISLGAGSRCYVFASDNSALDDTFQDLDFVIENARILFDHGTILSCRAGELAFFRTAWPNEPFIVHRPE